MVSIIKNKNTNHIKWREGSYPGLETTKTLDNFPFFIPTAFLDLLKIHDGGDIEYDFNYFDVDCNSIMQGCIGTIYGINTINSKIPNKNFDHLSTDYYNQKEFFTTYNNLIDGYYHPPEFFPKNIVPFARDGGGNFVCFDYRSNPKTNNPPIVYWNHEADIGKDVSFIAKNFDEFISMLKESD